MNEVIRPIIKEAPGVSQDVFNAFKKGNMMWPQYSFAIKVFIENAVLQEAHPDWKQFARSKLSTEQEDELSRLMADAHHKNAIPIAMKRYADPDDKTLREGKITNLWNGAKSFVMADLLNFVDGRQTWIWNRFGGAPATLSDGQLDRVTSFFSVPENQDRLRLVSTISNINKFLLEEPQLHRSNIHRQKVIAAHQRSVKPFFSYPDMRQDLLTFLDEKIPGEDADWVVWGV